VRNDRELLYDLERDPGEVAPMDAASVDEDAALAKLRAALSHPAVTGTATAVAPAADEPAASAEEVAEIERKMQLLGYM
jgi:hypothetical protein